QYDVNKYLDNNHEIIADLESIKHKYKNFSTYEVHQVLCHPNCVISDAENHPYYFDDDHLNLTGANQLASVFEKIFKERNNVN
ncbi:SGNH hydrolase domain-containing protein, partial [Acinetobacter baumannii]|nr:SGNH hydrolase domain-containing protein [Acinetobacter baumannii]